jgi:UDP-2,3-diacylglucosamine pyrophosphatase LpxH
LTRLAVLSDAHLLMQADWVENEEQLTREGNEVLENFEQALFLVEKDKPDAIVLAGDMFDYRTKTGQRVAHREGEKYMAKVRTALDQITDNLRCKTYSLKGNHDSEAVLRSTEKALKGKFLYVKNTSVDVCGINTFFLNSNYQQGFYDISLDGIPNKADNAIIHESVPMWAVQGLSRETVERLATRFRIMINGHMHSFIERACNLPNFFLAPALVPSREIKGNWMVYFEAPGNLEPKTRQTPFGYLLVEDERITFKPYEPSQIVVKIKLKANKNEELLADLKAIYDSLTSHPDKHRLRVWVEAQTDPITIERLLWPEVRRYEEIWTIDIERLLIPTSPIVAVETAQIFAGKAFNLQELKESVLNCLSGKQKSLATEIFTNLFTKETLSGRPNEIDFFKRFLEIVAEEYKTPKTFTQRAWELARG